MIPLVEQAEACTLAPHASAAVETNKFSSIFLQQRLFLLLAVSIPAYSTTDDLLLLRGNQVGSELDCIA